MKKEPQTTDERISYIAANGNTECYDRKARCEMCDKCLLNAAGRCIYGGPFNSAGECDRGSAIAR